MYWPTSGPTCFLRNPFVAHTRADGGTSYSLYLLHLTVILLGSNLLGTRLVGWQAASFVIGSALATCALAPPMFRWVELPLIESGNRVCRWLAGRTGGVVRESRLASSPTRR